MKNRFAYKLIGYFSVILIVFSLIIGGVFLYLFRQHTVEMYKHSLEDRANKIAVNALACIDNPTESKNFKGYMSFLDDIAMADVWIVDKDSKLITKGKAGKDISYSELPSDAGKVIDEALEGKRVFSEGFSEVLGIESITAGVPIKDSSGATMGVVLLHSPVDGISDAVNEGFKLLFISIAVAILLSGVIAFLLSLKFTRPLEKMRMTTRKLSDGDYAAKTGVGQADEIGELASSIDALAERLDEASKESEKLENMRQSFISNISHELRTPVTVIRGSLEALSDGIITDPQKVDEYHKEMLFESIYLQRLVNDLLELSRLQNLDFKIEMGEMNISDAVEDVARSMKRIASKKDVSIEVKDEVGSHIVSGDYGRIRQMLINLVDNAVKFSSEGNVVEIGLAQNENAVKISVKDNGPGIGADEIDHIFERFNRSKSEQNKSGTGLGLAIAQQIANRHGFSIEARSTPGVETVFTVSIPKSLPNVKK